jgi:hypothetical protein
VVVDDQDFDWLGQRCHLTILPPGRCGFNNGENPVETDPPSNSRRRYAVEFLGLPQDHTEDDLHRGSLDRMKDSIVSSSWSLKERTHSQSHS